MIAKKRVCYGPEVITFSIWFSCSSFLPRCCHMVYHCTWTVPTPVCIEFYLRYTKEIEIFWPWSHLQWWFKKCTFRDERRSKGCNQRKKNTVTHIAVRHISTPFTLSWDLWCLSWTYMSRKLQWYRQWETFLGIVSGLALPDNGNTQQLASLPPTPSPTPPALLYCQPVSRCHDFKKPAIMQEASWALEWGFPLDHLALTFLYLSRPDPLSLGLLAVAAN